MRKLNETCIQIINLLYNNEFQRAIQELTSLESDIIDKVIYSAIGIKRDQINDIITEDEDTLLLIEKIHKVNWEKKCLDEIFKVILYDINNSDFKLAAIKVLKHKYFYVFIDVIFIQSKKNTLECLGVINDEALGILEKDNSLQNLKNEFITEEFLKEMLKVVQEKKLYDLLKKIFCDNNITPEEITTVTKYNNPPSIKICSEYTLFQHFFDAFIFLNVSKNLLVNFINELKSKNITYYCMLNASCNGGVIEKSNKESNSDVKKPVIQYLIELAQDFKKTFALETLLYLCLEAEKEISEDTIEQQRVNGYLDIDQYKKILRGAIIKIIQEKEVSIDIKEINNHIYDYYEKIYLLNFRDFLLDIMSFDDAAQKLESFYKYLRKITISNQEILRAFYDAREHENEDNGSNNSIIYKIQNFNNSSKLAILGILLEIYDSVIADIKEKKCKNIYFYEYHKNALEQTITNIKKATRYRVILKCIFSTLCTLNIILLFDININIRIKNLFLELKFDKIRPVYYVCVIITILAIPACIFFMKNIHKLEEVELGKVKLEANNQDIPNGETPKENDTPLLFQKIIDKDNSLTNPASHLQQTSHLQQIIKDTVQPNRYFQKTS